MAMSHLLSFSREDSGRSGVRDEAEGGLGRGGAAAGVLMIWRLCWPRLLYSRVSGVLWIPISAPEEEGRPGGAETRPLLGGS